MLDKNLKYNSTSVSLLASDHVWVIEGFQKGALSSVFHPKVKAIMERYVSRGECAITTSFGGKPIFSSELETPPHFNLSHSAQLLVLMVSKSHPVGIDVEFLKPRGYKDRLSARYFGNSREGGMELIDFYRSWTAREAFVKTIGCGIDKNFANIQVCHKKESSLVGIDFNLSHEVKFLSFKNLYLIAACRNLQAASKKPIVYFAISVEDTVSPITPL